MNRFVSLAGYACLFKDNANVFLNCIANCDTMWYNSIRKVVDTMATRTANVTARVEPEIKEQAEAVMEKLGIPVSTAINMFYREIILWNGLPFRPSVPMNELKARDEMTKEEFDQRMSVGLAQAKEGMTAPAGKVYERLMGELGDD